MLCVERGYVVMLIRIVSIIFPLFAERYRQEPDKVASIVMVGNVAALLFIPLALALALD